MSERDPVAVLLKTLERPVAPRREFAEALRGRLLTELAEANGHRSWMPRLPLPPRPRRPRRMLAAALAVVLLASALVAVLVTRPAPASALDLIRQAQRAAASPPPFEATVRFDINPDGSEDVIPKGATETMQVSYGGPKRLRTVIRAEHTTIPGARPVGSYDVVNGNHYGSYDAQRKIFHTGMLSPYTRPLGDLAWKGGYPDWEKVCRGSAGQVLPDTRVADRDARHIRCTNPGAQVWQLWIDRQTGLLLKLVGQTGGEDDFFDAAPLTSQRGGFTITRLRYHPTFPAGTFKIAAPPGALDYEARLREAEAKVPPFRALVSERSHSGRLQPKQLWWWQDNGTWRINNLAASPTLPGGPGSFEVSAHGSVRSYNARDHSYSTSNATPNYPIVDLLPESDPRYPGDCPIVGHDQIEGRPAVHRRCTDRETWIDAVTGLTLQTSAPGYQLRLRNLHYHPAFTPGTFRFTRPPRSRSAQQLANDPYYKTRLRPGKPAPNWRARLLNGGSFQITDLRGRPALLLLLADWCLNDPACNVFTPLERIYQQSKPKLAIIWIDVQGNPAEARKVIGHNHLTFPVVNDPGMGNSVKAWKLQGVPYWVLLDSHGRVIEARLKPQTLAQLRQLVNEAK